MNIAPDLLYANTHHLMSTNRGWLMVNAPADDVLPDDAVPSVDWPECRVYYTQDDRVSLQNYYEDGHKVEVTI
jgi:hypothetical protein